jgi:glycosyltransferase involved in cell wall biosynthesis
VTAEPRIVAVAPGDPMHPGTFSGISRGLLTALQKLGVLNGAVDGRPASLGALEKAASVSPSMERWRQWYNTGASWAGPSVRTMMSRTAARRAASAAGDANVLLQLTGWYDPALASSPLRLSYHDSNLALFLKRPDLRLDASSRRVRAALDYERRLYGHVDLILCMSEWLRRSFIEDFDQAPEKVVTVGAGANVPVPERLPERPEGPPRVLFVGKQFERKGGPSVVRAFHALRRRHAEAELAIVGPTGLTIDEPGVRMLGRVEPETMSRLYREATMFTMPSVYEPFGIAVLEAMANGLPCIVSDSCALPEIVEDGRSGLVARRGDPEALAERMLALAADPARARAMGEAGHGRVRARFNWDSVASRVLDETSRRL